MKLNNLLGLLLLSGYRLKYLSIIVAGSEQCRPFVGDESVKTCATEVNDKKVEFAKGQQPFYFSKMQNFFSGSIY